MSADKTKKWSRSLRDAGLLDDVEDAWSLPEADDLDSAVIRVDGVARKKKPYDDSEVIDDLGSSLTDDERPSVEEIPFGVPVPSIPPGPMEEETSPDAFVERGVPWSNPPVPTSDNPSQPHGVVVHNEAGHSTTGARGLLREDEVFSEEQRAGQSDPKKMARPASRRSAPPHKDGPPEFATERFFMEALESESPPPRETKDRLGGNSEGNSEGNPEEPLVDSWNFDDSNEPSIDVESSRPRFSQEDETRPVPLEEALRASDKVEERVTSPGSVSFDDLMTELDGLGDTRETLAQPPSEQLLAAGGARRSVAEPSDTDRFSVEDTTAAIEEFSRMSSAPPEMRREPLVPGPPSIPPGLLEEFLEDDTEVSQKLADEAFDEEISQRIPSAEPARSPSTQQFVSVRGQKISVPPSQPEHGIPYENAIVDEPPSITSQELRPVVGKSSVAPISGVTGAGSAEASTPNPFEEMAELFDMGDYSGALSVAETILADDPQNDEAVRIRDSAKDILVQMYEARFGSLERVPTLAIPMEEVLWRNLDPATGFILSRIDGVCSFEDICDISGLPKFETYRILGQLLLDGIIG